jgi:hypothetical protein
VRHSLRELIAWCRPYIKFMLIWTEFDDPTMRPSLTTLASVHASALRALAGVPDTNPAWPTLMREERRAQETYKTAADDAHARWTLRNDRDEPRTHILAIGVGAYEGHGLPELTTSVHGAWAFTKWALTEFVHRDRPLGSVELLLSLPESMPTVRPSMQLAARLGLPNDTLLEIERATSENVQAAFDRWRGRTGTNRRNAALLYYSGHGVRKTTEYILPQDAQLPTLNQPPEHLFDIRRTLVHLGQFKPELQCFFIDACQDISPALLTNLSSDPGRPLAQPTNAVEVDREAWLFLGSRAGRLAFGPPDDAPYFTQELLACLRRSGAEPNRVGNVWHVTPTSLKSSLEPASALGSERVRCRLEFSGELVQSTFNDIDRDICQFEGPPEVFVKIGCRPTKAQAHARLSVTDGGTQSRQRNSPQPGPWYMQLPQGTYTARAEFDSVSGFARSETSFAPAPPMMPVEIAVVDESL